MELREYTPTSLRCVAPARYAIVQDADGRDGRKPYPITKRDNHYATTTTKM